MQLAASFEDLHMIRSYWAKSLSRQVTKKKPNKKSQVRISITDFQRMFLGNSNDYTVGDSSFKFKQKDDTMRSIRWSYNLFWTTDTCKDWDSIPTCIIGLSADP